MNLLKKLWVFSRAVKDAWGKTESFIALCFPLIPDSFFKCTCVSIFDTGEFNIFLSKVIIIFAFVIAIVLKVLCRKYFEIQGKNNTVRVEYGNIFAYDNCKKLIPFDECFTTKVGEKPEEINEASLCGQYLKKHPINNMPELIAEAGLKPEMSNSDYCKQCRYKSGSIIARDNYLLMAFAKLTESGKGKLSHQELIDCLFFMWEEIEKHYKQHDVCIPILGSGTTSFSGDGYSKQELLDILIWTYKLSEHKIKNPSKLIIVCQESDDFSLNCIGDSL